MSDCGSDRSSQGSQNMRASLARGAALAARDAAERNKAKSEEAAKLEAARLMAERRKSYGKVQKRVASPVKPSNLKRPPSPMRKDSDRATATGASPVPALRKASTDGKKRGPTPQGTPHKGGARKVNRTAPPLPPGARPSAPVSANEDANNQPTPEELENRPLQPEPTGAVRGGSSNSNSNSHESHMPTPAGGSIRALHPRMPPRRPGDPTPLRVGEAASQLPIPPMMGDRGRGTSAEELLASDDEFENIEAMCFDGARNAVADAAATAAVSSSSGDGSESEMERSRDGSALEQLARSPEHAAPAPIEEVEGEAAVALSQQQQTAAAAALQANEAAAAAMAAAQAAQAAQAALAAAKAELSVEEEESRNESTSAPPQPSASAEEGTGSDDSSRSDAPTEAAESSVSGRHSLLFDRPGLESAAATEGDSAANSRSQAHVKVIRQERGSLFSRLRLGGGSPEAAAAPARPTSQQLQQLDAMSEQLEAVTSCMRVEQQARVAAEAQLAEAREQMQGLLKHLNETEKARKEEAQTMSALRGLLEQIQCENQGLKEQNASLVSQCRTLSGREAKQEDLKPEPPQARGRPVPKRG